MIDARIQVTAEQPAAQMVELLAAASALGKDVVRVEVEYPAETRGDPILYGEHEGEPASWELSGDALEIDFRTDPPTVATLPPYSEVAP